MLSRSWRIGAIAACSAVALGLAGGGWWMSRNWPFTQTAVTRTLEERFARQVVIGSFRETWFPPGFVAQDVRFLHRRRKELPPLFRAESFTVKASWTGLIRRHLGDVGIVGLRMLVPPSDPGSGKSPVMPVADSKSLVSSVGRIEADDAILEFIPRDPADKATVIRIQHLVLDHVGGGGVASFRCALQTDNPPGKLSADGRLGPWNTSAPSQTLISGKYTYSDADLKVFRGLQGILSSTGTFTGGLSKIETAGWVDVPKLHVDGSASSVHLTAQYRAATDSDTADTELETVEAHVGHTTILGRGSVSGAKGSDGKTARIEMAVNSGRVEDLLNYFSEERRASMTGAVRLHAYVELPPGDGFLRRVKLDGDFGVAGAKFTNPARQQPVNKLGESAAGETKDQQKEDPRTVLSNLRGHVAARNGIASVTHLSFDFAGANAEMNGSYNLLAKTVNLRGTLRTAGTLSDTASGFKSVMIKLATPLFKKRHETVVPFTITGSTSNPVIAVDWRKKL